VRVRVSINVSTGRTSGVATGGSGGSMNRGGAPELLGPPSQATKNKENNNRHTYEKTNNQFE